MSRKVKAQARTPFGKVWFLQNGIFAMPTGAHNKQHYGTREKYGKRKKKNPLRTMRERDPAKGVRERGSEVIRLDDRKRMICDNNSDRCVAPLQSL